MNNSSTHIIPDSFDGKRLDNALSLVLPDSGLRLRRRYCDEGLVQVNGRDRKPGYKVQSGQEIRVEFPESQHSLPEVEIVSQSDTVAALFKPAKVHSASIVGKDTPNVESALMDLFPDHSPVLLNRLDYLTSGLLLVGLNRGGCDTYHAMESDGTIRKFYLALVEGRFDGTATVKCELDVDNRKVTRILETDTSDERRWTEVHALGHDRERNITLVRCMITKGARHQIRAHLSSIDHPIVGDPVYGNGSSDEILHLHHYKVEMDDFTARIGVGWADDFAK